MKTFVIQSQKINEYIIPAQSYGYTAIESIQYTNWFRNEHVYAFLLNDDLNFKSDKYNYLSRDYIPIGSVEYVLQWLKLMGVKEVKPLNIPKELWRFCSRKIKIDYCNNVNGHWMLKDIDIIKCPKNGEVQFTNSKIESNVGYKKYFLSEWIPEIDSEFRVFVFNKSIKGIRCYSGNECNFPDLDYIQSIVNVYNKRCYTLDVGVTKNGERTEIIELHDFFACGLYGFEDYSVLPIMWISTIADLLKR